MALLATTETMPTNGENQHDKPTFQDPIGETAPLVQRLSAHHDLVYMAIMALESEKFELQARRDYLRQQLEAVDRGFAVHIEDIEATLRMYEAGLHSLGPTGK